MRSQTNRTSGSREKSALIQEIIESQRRFNRVLRRTEPDVWMKLNLTNPQLRSLFYIANHGETNVRNLAAALGVTSSNVTGIIDRLVEQRLVTRQDNPEDRRMLILKTTDEGESLIGKLRERRFSQLSGMLGNTTLAELELISQGLILLCKAAEAYQKPVDIKDE